MFLFTGSVWPCKTKLIFQKQCLLHEVHGTQGNDLVNDIQAKAIPNVESIDGCTVDPLIPTAVNRRNMLRSFLVSICQKLICIIQDPSVELMVSDMTLHTGEGVQILVDTGIEVKCLMLIRQKELFEGTDESSV